MTDTEKVASYVEACQCNRGGKIFLSNVYTVNRYGLYCTSCEKEPARFFKTLQEALASWNSRQGRRNYISYIHKNRMKITKASKPANISALIVEELISILPRITKWN